MLPIPLAFALTVCAALMATGTAHAYGGPTTIPGSTSACTATMHSYAVYGGGVIRTHARTQNQTGCNEVRAQRCVACATYAT